MPGIAVIGAQWGDEAKGKVVHLLCRTAQLCVRFNGGANAGHTVVDRYGEARLHQIPAGALHPRCLGVLGHGMVLDPWALEEESRALRAQGRPEVQLLISERVHLVLPHHRAREEREGTAARIGTTRRGIGPAYADRVSRRGVRLADLRDPPSVRERLAGEAEAGGGWAPDRVLAELLGFAERRASQIGDARSAIVQALADGQTVLFEGAQGTLLDLDFGTYPYVTSSPTTAHGIGLGTGVRPELPAVVGVAKAYATRVGAGPFPTEDQGALGARLREAGQEYGATTGRPRRCGWLDLVALRYSHAVNGFTHLALTKLDVLSGLPEIRVAVAYRLDGRREEEFPATASELARAEPIYEALPGWPDEVRRVRDFGRLPTQAQGYVRFVEEAVGVPVALIGTGPEVEAVIARGAIV